MRVVARIGCIVCAGAALWLAFLTSSAVMMAGFPDGHLTDYDKAADAPLQAFGYTEAGFGLAFLALAFSPVKPRWRAVGLLACLIAFALVAAAAHVGVPWYFGTHLGLDNGIGG
jgi:hypothetical protein